MKPKIHPDYHEITVKMTNGKTFKTRSTYGAKGDTLVLDIDTNVHPAWTGTNTVVQERGRVAEFNKRFGGMNFSSAKKPAAQPEDKKDNA